MRIQHKDIYIYNMLMWPLIGKRVRDREKEREREGVHRQLRVYMHANTTVTRVNVAHNREHKVYKLQGTDFRYTAETITLYKV